MATTSTPTKRKRATKAEMQLRARTAPLAKPKSTMLLPGLVQERKRMFDARMATLAAAPVRNTNTGQRYDGAELRPFDGRPGAMDAYSLPSRGME